jgi:hypothetical protein
MSFFQQFVDRDSEDQQRDDDASVPIAASPGEDHREKWVLNELPSRVVTRTELGVAGHRKHCFGCVYEFSTDAVTIPNQAFRELVLMASKCIGQMSLEALCTEMARIYKKFQQDVNSKHRHEDDVPLPDWDAATIAEHLKYHNIDPEVQTWIRLIEIQEMINIECESIIEINDKTGKRRNNKDALMNYERLIKLWYHVTSRPLDKQFAYRKGTRMDLDTINQPFVTKHQKTIVDYYAP